MLETKEIRGPSQGKGILPGPEAKEGWFQEGDVYGDGAESRDRRRAQGGAVITGQH